MNLSRKAKRVLTCALSLSMIMGMSALSTGNVKAKAKVKVSSVSVEAPYAKTVTVAKGKKVKLTPIVKVTPDKAANKKVKYASKDKKIATVSNKGVIKGIKKGTTKVTVTSKKNTKKNATITVKVIDKAVTKVKLDKSKASLKPGETLKLKASVKPTKKVSKTIIWSSSKESIATVSSKGLVTAVAPGTAVITATAADGSKKKAACKITVPQVTNIVSAEMMDYNSIHFTLSQATPLNLANIQLQVKSEAEGKYIRTINTKGLNTTDNINYYCTLDSDYDNIYNGQYVKLTIPILTGTNTLEFKAKTKLDSAGLNEVIIEGSINEAIGLKKVSFGKYITGEATYTATGLPAGFSTTERDGELYIYGKTAAVADNTIATITATDELGKTATRNVRFLIGSESVIVSYFKPVVELANTSFRSSCAHYIAGGSGIYIINAAPDAALATLPNIEIAKYSGDIFNNSVKDPATGKNVDGPLPVGEYTIPITITDKLIPNLVRNTVKNVSIHAGATITGILTDASGQPMAGCGVGATCTSNNNVDYYTASYHTDATGKYTIKVLENETYDVYSTYANTYNVLVPATGSVVNLSSAAYKVTAAFPVTGAARVNCFTETADYLGNDVYDINVIRMYQVTDITEKPDSDYDTAYYFRDNVCYMLPGTYTLVTYSNDSLEAYDANKLSIGSYGAVINTFTVANAGVNVTATINACPVTTLTPNVLQNVTIPKNSTAILTFALDGKEAYQLRSGSTNNGRLDITYSSSDNTTMVTNETSHELSKTYEIGTAATYTITLTNNNNYTVTLSDIYLSLRPIPVALTPSPTPNA